MRAFEAPRGMAGRLAGQVMAATNRPLQREALALADVRPGQRVLEVGYGPGELLALLLAVPGVSVVGVDPSRTMYEMARRRNAGADGRLDLRVGSAHELDLPAGTFDRILVVNNVRLWPDLRAGLCELHRLSAAGSRLVVADHSRWSPSRRARRLACTDRQLSRIEEVLTPLYGTVRRCRLSYADAVVAG